MCPNPGRVERANGNTSGIHEGRGDGPGRHLGGAAFLQRSVLAQTTSAQAQGKKLVVIFQRGAADGLNIVVPSCREQLLPAPADHRDPAKPAD